TPLLILYMLYLYNSWRPPFVVIGSIGLTWVVLWFIWVRPHDVALDSAIPHVESPSPPTPLPPGRGESIEPGRFAAVFADRRFWILVVVVVCINSSWHFFRVWMPYFLQTKHDYSETDTQWVTSAYYLVTDVGSLIAGYLTFLLARNGMSVHGSRLLVFSVCASLTTASLVMIFLSKGPGLILALLIVGFGALGLFPPFYSFSQELSVRHQGKVTGALGCLNWLAMAPMRLLEGKYIKDTGNYDLGLTLAGIMPLLAVAVLFFFWPTPEKNISNCKLQIENCDGGLHYT
ncbi:MAG: MFS transporter, partial [Gemmataceae bacterium]|nr:MFS transporter [Gemmataceae bacterium]